MRTIRWLVAGAAALMLTLVPVEMNDGALAMQDAAAAECLVMFEVCYKEKWWIFYIETCTTVYQEMPCMA